jgi:hypothetical protein
MVARTTFPKEVAMSRISRVLLVAVVALGVAAPSTGAVPDKKLGPLLGAMWKEVLETPTPQNPFNPDVGTLCVDLGGVVAPFSASGEDLTCTVKPGTKILIAAWSSECSTLEAGTVFFGRNEAELRDCAQAVNAGVMADDVSVTLDGRTVPVTQVTSPLQRLDLPGDLLGGNIFGAAPGQCCTPDGLPYLSVANGWVALLHPLKPGTHTITIDITGESPPGNALDIHNTTTIVVRPAK